MNWLWNYTWMMPPPVAGLMRVRLLLDPDFELPMGRVNHRYFHRERLEDIRQQLNIPARKPEEIRQDF